MVKKPFILGVDLDGVLADYFPTMRILAAEWLGKKVEDLLVQTDYEFVAWGIDKTPKGYPALHKFSVLERNLFGIMKPMSEAAQVLRRLSEANVRIRIITNRLCIKDTHRAAITQTVEWLDRYAIPYWDICFVSNKIDVKADLYIEDSPKNLKLFKEKGLDYLIYRNYSNRNVKGPAVNNWNQIEAIVNKKMKENGDVY